MAEFRLLSGLIDRLLIPRIGHAPGSWPRRVYEVVERMSQATGEDPVELLTEALRSSDSLLADVLLDAATVGHTSFFRHPEQFEKLRAELPRLAAKRRGPLRIWCAACSTGEEPYSVALVAEQTRTNVEILATDVNPVAIRIASAGRYTASRPGKLPGPPGTTRWQASEELKRRITFEVGSIIDEEPPPGAPFDLIFCRNVLIYFDRDDVAGIVERLAEHLATDGTLIVSPADAVLPTPDCVARTSTPGFLRLSTSPPASVRLPLTARAPSVRPPASVRGHASIRPFALPGADEPPMVRAARLLGSGDPEQAERVLTELLNQDPDHLSAWFLLGEALLQRDEPAQARAAFLRASRSSPRPGEDVDAKALRRAALSRANALKRS
jgi:chemotaxis protein methyltransferase CheR